MPSLGLVRTPCLVSNDCPLWTKYCVGVSAFLARFWSSSPSLQKRNRIYNQQLAKDQRFWLPCPYSVLRQFLSSELEAFKSVDLFIKKSKSVLLIKKFWHAWVWNNQALWVLALVSSPVSVRWFHVKLPPCRNLVLIKIMPNCHPRWDPLAQGCMCVMKSHNNGSKLPPHPNTLPPWNHIKNDRLLVRAMSFASFNKFWTSTKSPIPHTFISSLNSSFSRNGEWVPDAFHQPQTWDSLQVG